MKKPKPAKKAAPAAGKPDQSNLIPVIFSRAELEARLAELARLKLEETVVAAQLDLELQAARDRYEPRLARLRRHVENLTAAARAWAEGNRADFGRLRSLELPAATIGWRAGQPALKPLPGWTWDRVLTQLKSLAGLAGYVRVREEVNRARLLADRLALGDAQLGEAGLAVVQDDNFYVEPKLEVVKVAVREKLAA